MDEFGTAKKGTGFLHSILPSTPLPISPNIAQHTIAYFSKSDRGFSWKEKRQ
jgi:hypothetical protein